MTAHYSTGGGSALPACHTEGAGAPVDTPTLRARLIARRDALPKGSAKRAALDLRIRLITHDMLEACA